METRRLIWIANLRVSPSPYLLVGRATIALSQIISMHARFAALLPQRVAGGGGDGGEDHERQPGGE